MLHDDVMDNKLHPKARAIQEAQSHTKSKFLFKIPDEYFLKPCKSFRGKWWKREIENVLTLRRSHDKR